MPKARCPVTARGAEIADYFGTIQFRHLEIPEMGKYTRYDGKAGPASGPGAFPDVGNYWRYGGVFCPPKSRFGGHFLWPENALTLQGAPAQMLALWRRIL
jgi:hypothetical protein